MDCLNLTEVWPNNERVFVPCGKCLACLTTKRNDWSFRLLQEWRASQGALFITLTYHPRFVPENGVSKRHIQLFMKKLRKRLSQKVRYYVVAEYGSKTARPHYHLLLFNVLRYDEEFIRASWSLRDRKTKTNYEIGLVHIGQVTEASIRYCTKYVIQRHSFPSGMARPFALMSRAYGLGGAYLTDEMVKWHRENMNNFSYLYNQKVRLPRYYKDKIWWRWTRDHSIVDGVIIPMKVVNTHPDREIVGLLGRADAIIAKVENMLNLYDLGYDPKTAITEMRNAVLSRIYEKVAFTQTM